MSCVLVAAGKAVPERMVNNEELTGFLDTSDEWIFSRSGIRERHIAVTETVTSLSLQAANQALARAGIKPQELDLILCATLRGDYVTPSLACLVQQGLGASCPAFDINAACSGFLYALQTADSFFQAGRAKKVLVVAAEVMSRLLDWQDRSTCVLFGDGAGAAVLCEGDGLLCSFLTAQGGTDFLRVPSGTLGNPFHTQNGETPVLHMDGQEVFRFAVNAITHDLSRCLKESGLSAANLHWVVPHQANVRIIQSAAQKTGIPLERFYVNVNKYGNTSAASIPIALAEMLEQNLLLPGQTAALVAFGGGLTTGGAVLRMP